MTAPTLPLAIAAAVAAAASVPAPLPFPVNPPAAHAGAHCPGGGGRAIGEGVGRGYIRQELQIITRDSQQRVLGYVYSGSDGDDYIDLTPSDARARVRVLQAGDLPRPGAMLRYCFSGPWTQPWGARHSPA